MTGTDRMDDMVHVTRWRWGGKEWSPFSAAEMDRRQDALRAHMAAEDIDHKFKKIEEKIEQSVRGYKLKHGG